jgi:hypothetical protein
MWVYVGSYFEVSIRNDLWKQRINKVTFWIKKIFCEWPRLSNTDSRFSYAWGRTYSQFELVISFAF